MDILIYEAIRLSKICSFWKIAQKVLSFDEAKAFAEYFALDYNSGGKENFEDDKELVDRVNNWLCAWMSNPANAGKLASEYLEIYSEGKNAL